MEKYLILFVLLLTSSELKGQVVISHVNGPAVISNLHSTHTNSSTVFNVIDSYENHQSQDSEDDYKQTQGAVVIHETKPASISVLNGLNSGNQKSSVSISNLQSGGSLWDSLHAEGAAVNKGTLGVLINNTSKGEDEKPFVSMANNNKYHEQQTHYPKEKEIIRVGPEGILIHKTQSGGDKRPLEFTPNFQHIYYSSRGKTINIGPEGISIHKVQNNENVNSDGEYKNNFPVAEETINVGPAGLFIHKIHDDEDERPPTSTSNVYGKYGNHNHYKGQTINVGPAGIWIQKNSGDRKSLVSIANSPQNYDYVQRKLINVGPTGILIQE